MARAISNDQKRARRDEILAAARASFRRRPFEAIGMAGLAREAGLAKGTLYLYFETKEALFLALVEADLAGWFDAMDEALASGDAPADVDAIAAIVADGLRARPELPRLLAILHTALEHNVDFETAYRFKSRLRRRVLATGARLESRLPWLAPGEGAALILRMNALVIGFQHVAHPAPVIERVLAEPGMDMFAVDFTAGFTAALRDLLAGWANARRDDDG